jgi:hypothetical protein
VTATGKWTQGGAPHKGWICVDVEDLGSPDHVCEMCEVSVVRYVHAMKHSDYAGPLRVGCICAGRVDRNIIGARKRDDAFKASRKRRVRWLSREWLTSRAGNQYLNVDGFNVVVFPVDDAWGARILDRETGRVRALKRPCVTEKDAKLAAFDALIASRSAKGARR